LLAKSIDRVVKLKEKKKIINGRNKNKKYLKIEKWKHKREYNKKRKK
jgi:hypothetical protein